MSEHLDYDVSPEEVRVKRTSTTDPTVRQVYETTLKDGPRAYRFAYLYKIVDPNTEEFHHYSLKIDNWKRTKKRGWEEKPDRSIFLEQDEFESLVDFIESVAGGHFTKDGEFLVVRGKRFGKAKDLLRFLPKVDTDAKLEFIREVLKGVAENELDSSELVAVVSGQDRSVLEEIASAAKLVQYRNAFHNLIKLIEGGEADENDFQRLLEDNAWMFGSEYSELLGRRIWTRDEEQDFMLRRTVDDFLEIAEIKTPSASPLFGYDSSRDSYYPAAPLSKAVGQVVNYIEQVDRDRDKILAKDQEESLKIRARVIIGRDGDESQQAALKSFNGHLHRIEVLTFDQLARIAQRVLDVFRARTGVERKSIGELNDLPG